MPVGRGLKQFREDVANLPARYQCCLDTEMPDSHCTAEIEGVKLSIWLDDVCLYPTHHIAHVFPMDDSDPKESGESLPIPEILQDIQLSGDISEMIITIASIISAYHENPASLDSDEEMTEIEAPLEEDEDAYYSDDGEDWVDGWVVRRSVLIKENYQAVLDSADNLLQDISYFDGPVEGMIWIRIPFPDMMDANIFSPMEAETWSLSIDMSLWIVFQVETNEEDFKVFVRQAEHDTYERDLVKNVTNKILVLCVLETYIRKAFNRLAERTVLQVGRTILERLSNISKYCSICGEKSVDIPSLKPFCCSTNLCQYQFMYLDFNGELETILVNEPFVTDLLIQLAYVAAKSGQLRPYPDCLAAKDDEGVKDAYEICNLLHKLPDVQTLANYAATRNGLQENLKKLDKRLLPLLRWIVMSNTAHITKLDREEQMMVGIGKEWQQFKMIISTPEKEARFQRHKTTHGGRTIFAFHGSPLRNWHSILRRGLNFDTVIHGRAYGDGIYMARHLQTSFSYAVGSYASGYPGNAIPESTQLPATWKNSSIEITSMLSVNEVVLDKSCFVNTDPYLVVNSPEKVQTRYLIIRGLKDKKIFECDVNISEPLTNVTYHDIPAEHRIYDSGNNSIGYIGIVPQYPTTSKLVLIPKDVFTASADSKKYSKPITQLELPSYASPSATKYLQKELRNFLRTQGDEGDNAIFHIDRTKLDNLYALHAYLHNFAPDLPLAQDLKRLSLPNVEIEIKFGPQHPRTPPFVRVVQPRFLPFSHGGGGHVTAGGSLCMSTLTMDDWSPVYGISQVLVMVHAALSSVDPYPAKIANSGCYTEQEAMDAYIRVAATHGWRVPEGWGNLFSGRN